MYLRFNCCTSAIALAWLCLADGLVGVCVIRQRKRQASSLAMTVAGVKSPLALFASHSLCYWCWSFPDAIGDERGKNSPTETRQELRNEFTI